MADKKLVQILGDIHSKDNKVYSADRLGLDGILHKRLIIEGTAILTDIPGINGRSYPKWIIEREVNRLNKEWVPFGRLAGELNHPRLDDENNPKDYPIFEMNMSKICALIEELRLDGNKLYCRMVVVEGDHGAGDKLAALLRTGYVPGYSLRGAGGVIEGNDYDTIDTDYTLITIDVVGNPSFGKDAIISYHFESNNTKTGQKQTLLESIQTTARKELVLNRTLSYSYHRYNKDVLMSVLKGN